MEKIMDWVIGITIILVFVGIGFLLGQHSEYRRLESFMFAKPNIQVFVKNSEAAVADAESKCEKLEKLVKLQSFIIKDNLREISALKKGRI